MATTKTNLYKMQDGSSANAAKSAVGDLHGVVRHVRISHTLSGAVQASGDILKLWQLPLGARVIDFRIAIGDLGTTGAAKIGWAASADAVESADSTGFLGATTMTAATDNVMAGAVTGFCKKFAAPVDVQLEFTAATDAADGIVINGYFAYVQD